MIIILEAIVNDIILRYDIDVANKNNERKG